jgi:hypothetical protein
MPPGIKIKECAMVSYSTLDISVDDDAKLWEQGCAKLGMTSEHSVIKPSPTLAELTQFFNGSPNWIYISGHFAPVTLYNDAAGVDFASDRVTLLAGSESNELRKSSTEFQLHESATVLIFGACSVLRDTSTIRIMRQLFDNPLILGYAATCGSAMNIAMVTEFFKQVQSAYADQETIMNSWLEAMDHYYGGGENESRFRAVSPAGQEWQIKDSKIIRGRTI